MSSNPTSEGVADLSEVTFETSFPADKTEDLDTAYTTYSEPNVNYSNKTLIDPEARAKAEQLQEQSRIRDMHCTRKSIANILMTDKRACVRFRSELSWPQRLADDPIYERDTIHLNDNGNTDKARRVLQSKECGASTVKEVQALKQALVNGAEEVDMGMLINKLDSIETLANYVKDPAAADRVAAGRTSKHRAKRSNDSREESLEVIPADWEQGEEMSPYTTQATPSSMRPHLRSAYLEDTTLKKRKLENGRSAK